MLPAYQPSHLAFLNLYNNLIPQNAFEDGDKFFRVAAKDQASFELLSKYMQEDAIPTSYGGKAPYAEFEDSIVENKDLAAMRVMFGCDPKTGSKRKPEQTEEELVAIQSFMTEASKEKVKGKEEGGAGCGQGE